jgi:hypothetical protein
MYLTMSIEHTWTAAKNTSKPPMRPTSTQENISHNVAADEELGVKKVFMQFVLAVVWRVAETIAHAAPTANTTTMDNMCSVT